MKLSPLPIVIVALVPVSAQALERDLTGVLMFEAHGGVGLRQIHFPERYAWDGYYAGRSETTSTRFGGLVGLSAGMGLTRSVGLRLRIDTNFIGDGAFSADQLLLGGLDVVTCFGNAESLLWRPFVGFGFGHINGLDYGDFIVPRLGIDMLVPLSGAKDAAGFLLRVALDTGFRSDGVNGVRLGPMLSFSIGLAFDIAL